MFELMDSYSQNAIIKVLGVGGALLEQAALRHVDANAVDQPGLALPRD